MQLLNLVYPQVLTVHSPFRVENLTNQQLEFNVHLFRGPQTPGAPGKGAAAISVVPNNPLAPGQQTYLPVPAIWSDSLLLHACIHLMVLHACIWPSHIVHHLLQSVFCCLVCLLACSMLSLQYRAALSQIWMDMLLHSSCNAWQHCTNPMPKHCTMSHEVLLMQGRADVCACDWVGDRQEGQD